MQCSFLPAAPLSLLHNSVGKSSLTPYEESESFTESDIGVDSDTDYHCDARYCSDHLERYIYSLALRWSVTQKIGYSLDIMIYHFILIIILYLFQ